MSKSGSLPILAGAAIAAALLASAIPQTRAANIISFGDTAPTNCGTGGSTLCSTNGTIGYNGTMPFDLTTISQWFQLAGTTPLPGQTVAQTSNNGEFDVVNNTGATLTTYSLTITDNFTSSTPSVTACTGAQTGKECDNFQIEFGNNSSFVPSTATESLSGADFDSCTNGVGAPKNTLPCMQIESGGNQAAANFAPTQVTYTWSGLDIPNGDSFGINFASWNKTATVPAPLIDHGPFVLLAVGGVLFGARLLERSRKRR
jgi:hypothetical protein